MNCSQAREKLPLLLYDDLDRDEASIVQTHLAQCHACKAEFVELSRVREVLNVVPTPNVSVDVDRISAEPSVARSARTRSKRWKQIAFAMTAAAIVLAFALNVEFRIDGQQLIVRWGNLPAQQQQEAVVSRRPATIGPVDERVAVLPNLNERIRVLDDLVHALAEEVNSHGRQQRDSLSSLQTRLRVLEQDARNYRAESDRSLAALYTAYFQNDSQGEKP